MKPLDFSPGEELATIDAGMLAEVLAAFEPPLVIATADWAEAYILLTDDTSAEPGPLKLSAMQRAVLTVWDDPKTRVVVLKTGAQCGKSTIIEAILLSSMDQDNGPMVLVRPTDTDAVQYSSERLDPMIASIPAIKTRLTKSTNKLKSYPGGSLFIASAHKSEELASKQAKKLIYDEVDRFPRSSSGSQGDPIETAAKRQHTFRDYKRLAASTPTLAQTSRISEMHATGTDERWAIACPECGCLQVPTFDHIQFKPGNPETAKLVCTECAHPFTERERQVAIETGVFIAFNINPDPGVRSFHTSQLVSKFAKLEAIVREYERASTPDRMKVFVNTVLGETFDPHEGASLDVNTLQARAVKIVSPYSREIEFITAGIDVSANRVEITFLAHAKTGERFILDHQIVVGDVSDWLFWQALKPRIEGAAFHLEDGRHLPLSATFIDSGHATSNVYRFAVTTDRCSAVKGVGGWDKPNIEAGKMLRDPVSGQSYAQRLIRLGVDNLKLAVTRALNKVEAGPGFIHLPAHLPADYFEQFGNERLQTTVNARGIPTHKWVRSGDQEPLDCLAYALAAGELAAANPAPPIGSKPSKTIAQQAKELHDISNAKPSQDQDDNVLAFRKAN